MGGGKLGSKERKWRERKQESECKWSKEIGRAKILERRRGEWGKGKGGAER